MPKPLSARKRNAVLTDIRAGVKSRNQIARDHGVSASTVTGLAKAAGIDGAFDRTKTKDATRAHEADGKALRAQLKVDLLHDAQKLRARIWGSHQVVVATQQGAEIVTLAENPLAEMRSGYTALGIVVDKSIRLEQHDAEGGDGLAAVDEWLRGMMGGSR